MAWRSRVEEFEADLYKVPMPRFFRTEKGELERTTYGDGEEKLEIGFRGVDVPDGQSVGIVIDGKEICQLLVNRGRARHELSNQRGDVVPRVAAGQVVEICYQGKALLRGTFERD